VTFSQTIFVIVHQPDAFKTNLGLCQIIPSKVNKEYVQMNQHVVGFYAKESLFEMIQEE